MSKLSPEDLSDLDDLKWSLGLSGVKWRYDSDGNLIVEEHWAWSESEEVWIALLTDVKAHPVVRHRAYRMTRNHPSPEVQKARHRFDDERYEALSIQYDVKDIVLVEEPTVPSRCASCDAPVLNPHH